MKKRLVLVGIVFMFVTFFLIAISFTSENVKAGSASGTWTGTCTDQTGAADYHYDVVLTLNGGSSVSGTLKLTCTSVDVKISGWGGTQSMVGTVQTCSVEGMMSGSSLTLYATDQYGCTYTFTMTVSGGTMTGGGHYTGGSGETDTWTFNLKGGGGSDLGLGIPSASLAFAGGALGLAASSSHIVRGGAVHKNRGPFYPGRTPVRQRPDPHRPFNARPQPQNPTPVQAPPPQPQQQPQPPPANLAATLNLPIQEEIGPSDGVHLVPRDAPQQCVPERDPPGYPYPKGTSCNMECPYCHCPTLSPFTTGWYCTNAQCPARRENVQKGYTHHEFNKMTWRVL